jgi:hypothetical protein
MKSGAGRLMWVIDTNDFPGNGNAGSNPAASALQRMMYGRVVYGGGLALVPRLLFARPLFSCR